MISIMILDNKNAEIEAFRKYFGNLIAIESDERLEWRALPDHGTLRELLDQGCVIHMAVLDVTQENGISSAVFLREKSPDTEVMIIADLSISPMEYMNPLIRASSLLLRPFDTKTLEKTAKTFFSECYRLQTADSKGKNFLVENNDGKTVIPYSGIFYFEAREKKVFVRTASQEYGIYDTIENLQKILPEQFLRCHRSFIVNTQLIEKIRLAENSIYLEKGISIPLSRTYKNTLKEYINGTTEA